MICSERLKTAWFCKRKSCLSVSLTGRNCLINVIGKEIVSIAFSLVDMEIVNYQSHAYLPPLFWTKEPDMMNVFSELTNCSGQKLHLEVLVGRRVL